MKIIDISIPVNKRMILWPGSPGLRLKRVVDMKKGRTYNETFLEMSAHTGTHIDAPLHFISKGKSIDKLSPEIFIGRVFVADLSGLEKITSKDLEKIKLPRGVKRLLLKTSNSSLYGKKNYKFKKDYVGLTAKAAEWLAKRSFKLVGIDYLSVAKFDETAEVHKILLSGGMVILESINLSNIDQGEYQLVCLPIKISGIEAGLTRAVLLTRHI